MTGSAIQRLPLLAGLILGLIFGLIYTWYLVPVELVNTYPALMRSDFRRDWIRVAALSYVADGDLERAQKRLDGLEREDVAGAMEALIEEYAAAGRPAETMRRLATLARALDVHTPMMLVYLDPAAASPSPTPSQPTLTPLPTAIAGTSTPSPTLGPTPKPTRTPRPPTATPTPIPPFRLAGTEQICEPGETPHIEVVVQDENGEELAGIEVWLLWTGGTDRAVTGLKPKNGAGYADFDAQPDVDYTLGTSELGAPLITGLRIELCPEEKGKERIMGSWRVALERRASDTGTPEPAE